MTMGGEDGKRHLGEVLGELASAMRDGGGVSGDALRGLLLSVADRIGETAAPIGGEDKDELVRMLSGPCGKKERDGLDAMLAKGLRLEEPFLGRGGRWLTALEASCDKICSNPASAAWIRFLLERGAPMEASDGRGGSPLRAALMAFGEQGEVRLGKRLDGLDALISRGASVRRAGFRSTMDVFLDGMWRMSGDWAKMPRETETQAARIMGSLATQGGMVDIWLVCCMRSDKPYQERMKNMVLGSLLGEIGRDEATALLGGLASGGMAGFDSKPDRPLTAFIRGLLEKGADVECRVADHKGKMPLCLINERLLFTIAESDERVLLEEWAGMLLEFGAGADSILPSKDPLEMANTPGMRVMLERSRLGAETAAGKRTGRRRL